MFENDDWDIDEDYFNDFNDDAIEGFQNVKDKTQTLPSSSNSDVTKNLSADNLQFQFNGGTFEDSTNKGLQSVTATSHKNVILDVFKNNNIVQSDSTCSKESISLTQNSLDNSKKPCTSTSKDLILNIFQSNHSTKLKDDHSSTKTVETVVKSVLKITEADCDNKNKFKRKKSVAFSESLNEVTTFKKKCISANIHSDKEQASTSKMKSPPTIFNQNDSNKNSDSRKQMLLDVLKSPIQKNIKSPLVKKTVIRKFPGPAGLLLDDHEETEVINLDTLDENKNKNKKHSDICSQNTKNLFTTGAWQLMMDDLPAGFELRDIASIKENALEYGKKCKKVPYFAGIIQYIDYKPNDPHVILKDFSGKIDARIHHSICKLYPNALGTNIVVLVKDVGIIVTSKKYVCIIISPKNLVSIYSDDNRLVETPHLEELLGNNANCDLHESQINLSDIEDDGKNKIDDKKSCSKNVNNCTPVEKSTTKNNLNAHTLVDSSNENNELSNNLTSNNTKTLNDQQQNVKQSNVTNFVDVQEFDFDEDDSWFGVNIDDINSFTAHQFPSSTPMVVNKELSQNKTADDVKN